MDKITQENALEIASKALKVESTELNIRPLDNDLGYYAYQSVRGGNSVIIANDKSFLCATSSVDFDRHLEAFDGGKRTEI